MQIHGPPVGLKVDMEIIVCNCTICAPSGWYLLFRINLLLDILSYSSLFAVIFFLTKH